MKRYGLPCLLATLWLGVSPVQAHTHLLSSEPANDSVLTALPKQVTLEFPKPVQLTAVSLYQGEKKIQDLAPLPRDAAKKLNIALPSKLPAGAYSINWRTIGADQHVMSGKVNFTLQSK